MPARFPGKLVLGVAGLSAYLLTASGGYALPPRPPQDAAASRSQTEKEKKKSERKLLSELDSSFRKWLEEDVVYIISDEEKKAFLHLTTNEEREQFIESFWQRRNPDPESPENTYKEEHYRRIAYANERFASGLPGWRTDRGRIYITWGPPDEVDRHPFGGAYERTPEEGGGSTTAFPFEDWRYRHIDGIGDDITVEFVDTTSTGEFHITTDPCEKDALAHSATGGPTLSEAGGGAPRAQRFVNPDGTTCGQSLLYAPEGAQEFDRYFQYAQLMSAPQVKFKDLDSMVTSRVVRNQLPFEYELSFLRVTSDTVLVPITIQLANHNLTFETKDGVSSATVDVYGRISTLSGRVVQKFEDSLNRDVPESLSGQTRAGLSIYQKAVPLQSGLYRLDLVVKDVKSGNVGVIGTRLAVPHYDYDNLSASTLLLADQMERVSSKQVGLGQFVIGDAKVRPRVDQTFTEAEHMNAYLQIYNLKVDEKTHRTNVTYEFLISQIDAKPEKVVFHKTETSDEYGQSGQQVSLAKRVPLNTFPPGRYKFLVNVTDNVTKQTISPSAEFTVKRAAPPTAAKN